MYRRTQPGTLLVVFLLITMVVLGVGLYLVWLPIPLVIAEAILLLTLVIFRSLTIEIDADELRCWFGGGLIKRRFRLAEIVSAEPVRNHWYYGWGIRLVPGGWMFNVSGLDAIELTLASGRRFRIGTDDPKEVVEAIRRLQG